MLTQSVLKRLRAAEYGVGIFHAVPKRAFRGVNFVTPRVVAYYRGSYGQHVAYIELSTGDAIFPGRPAPWGVTARRYTGEPCRLNEDDAPTNREDASGVFDSRDDALNYIAETFLY